MGHEKTAASSPGKANGRTRGRGECIKGTRVRFAYPGYALTSAHKKGPAMPALRSINRSRAYGVGFGSGLRGIICSRIAAL